MMKEMNNKKYRSKFISVFAYNKVFALLLALCLQGFVLFSFIKWLTPYISIYLGSRGLLSAAFCFFLVNTKGKNEFKIAWLLPVVLAPLFGIFLYVFYHNNGGGRWLKRELKKAKEKNSVYFKDDSFSESELSVYLKKFGNFPSYKNCRLDFMESGEKFFEELLKDIEKAENFVFLEFFILYPDSAFEQLIELLKRKAAQGIEVRVMFDSLGSITLSTKRNLKYLRSMGINAESFLPIIPFFSTHQNNRDHRKIAVIDNRIAYTGGVNIADEYMNYIHPRFDYWKDTGIRIEGKAAKSFTGMFLENWNISTRRKDRSEDTGWFFQETEMSFPENGITVPYGDDALNEEDLAENVYMNILGKAEKYVHITTPYFIVDNGMKEAICFAARRGVEVKIILPSKADHFITFCVGRVFLRELIECGVQVYEYIPGFIHAKEFISDDIRATVGSVNLDYRSLFHHFECGVYMENTNMTSAMEKDFDTVLSQCRQITMDEYKKISKFKRALGWCFRIFGPLM